MFMNAAPAPTHAAEDPVQRDPARGRLLGLVRALIEHGRDLVAMLQSRNPMTPPIPIARRFGCLAVALIINRITRGLMIAAALERRLLHPRPRAAGQVRPTTQGAPRASRAPREKRLDEDEELLGDMPSAKEIAARLRNRKTGAVLADICRDLGINAEHPLWRQINLAIIVHGGNTGRLLQIWLMRAYALRDLPPSPEEEALYTQFMSAFAQPP